MYIIILCSAQFVNLCNFKFALRKLEIYKLRNYLQKVLNCARRIAQFVNSDLRLVSWPRSLAAVTKLGWKLRYSPDIQPPLSLCRLRSQVLRRLTALINCA